MGRPSKYSTALANRICEEIASGKSLLKICEYSWCPSYRAIMSWLTVHKEFQQNYERAVGERTEHYAHEIIDIADEQPIRRVCNPDGSTSDVIDSAGIARNRLRVDARKWIAAKLLPKKSGDRMNVEHSNKLTLEQLVCGDD